MHKDIGALVDGLLVGVDPIGMVAGYHSGDKFLFLGHLAGKYALGREYVSPCGHKEMQINNCEICYQDFHGHREPELHQKERTWEEKFFYGAGVVSGLTANIYLIGIPQLFALGIPLTTWADEKMNTHFVKKTKKDYERKHLTEPKTN